MLIGILVAMQREYDSIKNLIKVLDTKVIDNREFVYGVLPTNNHVVCAVSGIGKVNAAVTALTMIKNFKVDHIISTGCCGGLNSDSQKVGNIHVGTSYRYHDVYCGSMSNYGQIPGKPEFYKADKYLIKISSRIYDKYKDKVHFGLMVTGDRFIDTQQDVLDIDTHFPIAETCEMESTAIAQVCYEFNVPFIAFRIISDLPGGNNAEEHMKKFENFWDTMADSIYEFTKDFLESIPLNMKDIDSEVLVDYD